MSCVSCLEITYQIDHVLCRCGPLGATSTQQRHCHPSIAGASCRATWFRGLPCQRVSTEQDVSVARTGTTLAHRPCTCTTATLGRGTQTPRQSCRGKGAHPNWNHVLQCTVVAACAPPVGCDGLFFATEVRNGLAVSLRCQATRTPSSQPLLAVFKMGNDNKSSCRSPWGTVTITQY